MLHSFLEYLKLEKQYSSHTVSAYRRDIEQCFNLLEVTSDSDIKELSYNSIRWYITTLMEDGIKPRSINRKVSSLNAFFKFLLKIDELDASPLENHTSLKTAQQVQTPFSKEEVFAILNRAIDETDFIELRNKLIIELLYVTGMRREELLTIELRSLDLDKKTIRIIGKRNKERIAPILKSLTTVLEKYIVLRNTIAQKGINNLIITDMGKPAYPSLIYRTVQGYFKEVSTKHKISPHILRHSFATHLLDEGAQLNAVKDLLGHSSLASTQVYIHTSMEQLKNVYKEAHPRSKKG